MNYRLLAKYLGHFSCALGGLMIFSAGWAVYFQEWEVLWAFVESMLISLGVGAALALIGRNALPKMHQREALGLVGMAWLVAAGLGALPYVLSDVFGPVDAYFESMSGFTTTGSSVLTDIEGTAKSILFWRSFTHWLGGMGIIVLCIAVLPYLGAGGKLLFKSESPGPDPRGLRPKIQDTASILYIIYGGLTIIQTAALMAAGMTFFDALCHTFGTLATGGFSTRQASVGGFDSLVVNSIIIFFMVCAGSNFALYFAMLRGKWKSAWRDTEWRVYMAILVLSTVAITANLLGVQFASPIEDAAKRTIQVTVHNHLGTELEQLTIEADNDQRQFLGNLPARQRLSADMPSFDEKHYTLSYTANGKAHEIVSPIIEARYRHVSVILDNADNEWQTTPNYTLGQALHHAAFQVVSIMTTTGYCSADYDLWPYFSRMLLLVLMFVGGCAGSTGGGLKVVRIVMLAKLAYRRLEKTFQPKTVRAIRIGGEVVSEETQQTVYAFFVLYIAWFVGGALLMSLMGLPFQTAVTSVAATLNNIGPGLEAVGATMDYHLVPALGKVFLSLCMALGRLELFSICVLFAPSFWRTH